MFTPEEMKGHNVHGRSGKEKLDPNRISAIRAAVTMHWGNAADLGSAEEQFEWRRCVIAIDKGIRNIYPLNTACGTTV